MFTINRLLSSACCLVVASASIQIAFPINSQVPPLAQVAQSYDFQFSGDTFTSGANTPLRYSLEGAPGWLSLDSPSRTFSGTPALQDVGDVSFQIIASDGESSVAMPITLVVSNAPVPRLTVNMSDILSRAGSLSDLQSLAVYPRASFSIVFPEDVFVGASNLTYYATSADRSPLPAWIRFDDITLAISGMTPPPVPNPQVVPIRLIASEVLGFTSQSVVFNVIISDHHFVFASVEQEVHATPGQFVNVSTKLLLDGQQAPPQVVVSVQAPQSDWLQFDSLSSSFSGHVPSDRGQQEVQIVASDIFNDDAYTYLRFGSSAPQLFAPSSPTPATARSVAGPQDTGTTSPSDANTSSVGRSKSRRQDWIVAAIVVPIAIVIILLILGALCIRRRRQRHRPSAPNYVEQFAGKSKSGQPKSRDQRLSVAIATASPMGSPEQRLWDSQESSEQLRGLGLSISRSTGRRSVLEMHPLRGNAVPSPPKRSSKRLARASPHVGHKEARRSWLGSRRDQVPWDPVVHGARLGEANNIAVCIYCESDNLTCLDCGGSQVTSAPGQVGVQRRAHIERVHQSSIRRIVEDGPIRYGSSFASNRERDMQVAEEYNRQPQEKKWASYCRTRRQSGQTGERFSNSGSGSSLRDIRRWHSGGSVRGPQLQNPGVRCFSDASMPIPEESPRSEGQHVRGRSGYSGRSWVTEDSETSENDTDSVIDPSETREASNEERGMYEDRDYDRMVSGVRMVDDCEGSEGDGATQGGMPEEYPSSDYKVVL